MRRTTKSGLTITGLLLLAAGAAGIGYRLGVANHASECPNSEIIHSVFQRRIDFEWPSESMEDKSKAPYVGDADVRPIGEPLSIHVPPLESGFLLNALWPLSKQIIQEHVDNRQFFSFTIAASR
jgi:hypothetical protein